MANLYIPFCSIVLSLFIIILFIAKVKRYKNNENIYYLGMIIDAMLATIFCIISIYLIYKGQSNNIIVKISNKLECFSIFNFSFNLFMYIYYSCDYKIKIDKLNYIINPIIFLTIFLLPSSLDINNDLSYMVVVGPTVIFTNFAVILMIILTFILSIKNYKRLNKKIIPVISYLIFLIFIALLRKIRPEFVCMEFLMSFSTLIMYHTIENPDLKMITKLELAMETAEKSNRAKSDFLSSMSHEIRTPLNAIVGLSENLKTSDEPDEDIEEIINASKSLYEIVGNILDINKIEAEQIDVNNVTYNTYREFNSIYKLNKVRLKNKNIDYKINIDNIPEYLYGDIVHIKQILNNLLSNAIKYTDKGFINLNISCKKKDNKVDLRIDVVDSGRGISEENISRLFNKFERLDAPINSNIEGTGLGLVITKSLVEILNGKIDVNSKLGKGSTFTVIIPQDIQDNISNIDNEDKEVDKDYGKKKVLIVDDNKLNIKVLKRSLKGFDFEIDECYDGIECIEKIKNNTYDLILMDIMMPKLNGTDTLKRLKKISNFNTPVIAVTADALNGSYEKYLSIGFTDYLSKPFTKEELLDKLNKVFIRKRIDWSKVKKYVVVDATKKDIE